MSDPTIPPGAVIAVLVDGDNRVIDEIRLTSAIGGAFSGTMGHAMLGDMRSRIDVIQTDPVTPALLVHALRDVENSISARAARRLERKAKRRLFRP